jgi:tetratricopeptide (TPR) repeat protein
VLNVQLSALVEAGVLERAGDAAAPRFQFRHALIQDAAYQSLLRGARRRFHREIAEAHTSRFPELRAAHPERYGNHWAAAGLAPQAIACWTEAGERAARIGSSTEAIAHFRRALELVEVEPAGDDRTRRELGLQMKLGDAYSVSRGYAAPETAEAYGRAQQIAATLGSGAAQRFEIVAGIYRFHYLRGDLEAARAAAREMMAAGEARGPLERMVGLYSLGFVEWSRGDFAPAMPLLEAALDIDLATWGAPVGAGAQLPAGSGNLAQGVQARCSVRIVAAMLLSHLGFLDRALALVTESVDMARAAHQPYSEAFAHQSRALVHFFRQDAASALADAHRVVEISREHGYFFAALGSVLLGWGMANEDGIARPQLDEAIGLMTRGLDGYRRSGARVTQTMYLGMLAATHRVRGDRDLAWNLVSEAIAAAETTGERAWLPELLRQRAMLAHDAGDDATNEADLRRALQVAAAQQNRLLEMRVARDVSRTTGGLAT